MGKILTWTEKEEIVKEYRLKIETLSKDIFDYVKDNGYEIFNEDDFMSDLREVIENNVDFHLPD